MKQIIFTYNNLPSINIGDYIQSLAAKQYAKCEINYVNRDDLNLYNGEKAKVIMNGWYTYKPFSCMPNDHVLPLFVSFHLNADIEKKFLNQENISILKKYAPIGCRDIHTVNLLRNKGIEAYFSGCLTTTIGCMGDYKSCSKTDDIFIVDPFSYLPNGKNIFEILKTSFQFMINLRPIIRLIKKYKQDNPFTINNPKAGFLKTGLKSDPSVRFTSDPALYARLNFSSTARCRKAIARRYTQKQMSKEHTQGSCTHRQHLCLFAAFRKHEQGCL